MAAQTLATSRFEVVVIINGPPGETPAVVESFASEHPSVRLRVVESSKPGVAHARNVGLGAAAGDYMTILDDDDWVSPRFLERLLDAIEPGVIPLAWMADVDDDDLDTHYFDNYYSNALAPVRGKLVRARTLPQALSLNVCKLIPISAARMVGYDEKLRGGSDFTFWAKLYARNQFRFRVIDEQDAVYYRTRGHGSLSRQDLSFDFSVTQRLDCISSLEEIPSDSPDIEGMAKHLVNAQIGHINRFLTEHPEERERVTAAIEERGARRIWWGAVNRDLAEQLALLYCFTPWNGTSGMVAARRVRARGVVVDVVCQAMDNVRTLDPGSAAIADPYVARRYVLPGDASFAGWNQVVAYSEGVFNRLAEEPDKNYRSVYSRAMWAASHIAAAQYKLRNPEVHWIAEFSDPLYRTIHGEPRAGKMVEGPIVAELRDGLVQAGITPPAELMLFEWAEYVAYALADEIVFTNQNQREYMLGYCPDPALVDRVSRISRVEHHPTLPPQFYQLEHATYPLEPDRVHIGYFGVFYPTRGLTEVTDALAALPAVDRARVQLHVFTNKPEDVEPAVHEAGLADVVRVNPYVPFLEFLNLTTKFDALVVNDAETSGHHGGINPYLPSKLSDYLGSGRPIWSISEPGSVLSTIDVAYRTSLGDVAAAVEVLQKLAASAMVEAR